MARCDACNQEMTNPTVTSCTQDAYDDFGDGVKYKRIPYDGKGRCHDCGVARGGLHHPGCDMERCPRCKGQAISCDCLNEEDEP